MNLFITLYCFVMISVSIAAYWYWIIDLMDYRSKVKGHKDPELLRIRFFIINTSLIVFYLILVGYPPR